MTAAVDSTLNTTALLQRIAPLFGAEWNEDKQSLLLDGKPWGPHDDDTDARFLADSLGIRFKSNAMEVVAYIGDSPAPDSGSVVARSPVVDQDKTAAARVAALACAALYASVPAKYRPKQQPQATQSQPLQQQGGVPQGVTDLIHLPIDQWPVEQRKAMAEALRLLACILETGI